MDRTENAESAAGEFTPVRMTLRDRRRVTIRAVRPLADRERAVVAVTGAADGASIVGGARYIKEGDGETCEFAITIADGWRGAGLASSMLRALIRDARRRGLKRMEGYVLAQNQSMLDLARHLHFEVGASEEGPTVKLVRLELGSTAA